VLCMWYFVTLHLAIAHHKVANCQNEDRCLMQHFFAGMCGGQYLDIGAHDG
jgi:geranylgeranyl pyrophosphate synthase